MRKFSRRTTIFMVATGILLTASIALAAATAVGSFTFKAKTAEAEVPPQPLDVKVDGTENLQLDRKAPGAPLTLHFGNPSTNDPVTLGVVPEGGTEPEGAVTFDVVAPDGNECSSNDLLITELKDWDGELLQPGESHVDAFTLDLKPDAHEDCDGVSLEITVTVSGETDADGDGPGDGDGDGETISGNAGLS